MSDTIDPFGVFDTPEPEPETGRRRRGRKNLGRQRTFARFVPSKILIAVDLLKAEKDGMPITPEDKLILWKTVKDYMLRNQEIRHERNDPAS